MVRPRISQLKKFSQNIIQSTRSQQQSKIRFTSIFKASLGVSIIAFSALGFVYYKYFSDKQQPQTDQISRKKKNEQEIMIQQGRKIFNQKYKH